MTDTAAIANHDDCCNDPALLLRTEFAAFWMVCTIVAAILYGLFAALFIGLPLGLLGFAAIREKHKRLIIGVLWLACVIPVALSLSYFSMFVTGLLVGVLGYFLIVVEHRRSMIIGTLIGTAIGIVLGCIFLFFWPVVSLFASYPLVALLLAVVFVVLISGAMYFLRLLSLGMRRGWLVGIIAGCSVLLYAQPYVECPIDLPPSAHNLYANSFGYWLSYHAAVRFDGSVEDCLAAADRAYRQYCDQFHRPYKSPIPIDMKTEPSTVIHKKHIEGGVEWWLMDAQHIEKGFYWEGGSSWEPEFWVDTERGVFYMLIND